MDVVSRYLSFYPKSFVIKKGVGINDRSTYIDWRFRRSKCVNWRCSDTHWCYVGPKRSPYTPKRLKLEKLGNCWWLAMQTKRGIIINAQLNNLRTRFF